MKRALKTIAALFLGVLLSVGTAAMSACAEQNAEIEYSITVCEPQGTIYSGVTVSLLKNGEVCATGVTGASGAFVCTLPKGTYDIELSDFGSDYVYTNKKVVTAEKHTVVVTLSENKITYTVLVVDNDGLPVQGISLGLCVKTDDGSGTCTQLDPTGADGKVQIDLAPLEYNVNVTDMKTLNSKGYTCDVDEHNYYTGGYVSPETPSITVRLTKI